MNAIRKPTASEISSRSVPPSSFRSWNAAGRHRQSSTGTRGVRLRRTLPPSVLRCASYMSSPTPLQNGATIASSAGSANLCTIRHYSRAFDALAIAQAKNSDGFTRSGSASSSIHALLGRLGGSIALSNFWASNLDALLSTASGRTHTGALLNKRHPTAFCSMNSCPDYPGIPANVNRYASLAGALYRPLAARLVRSQRRSSRRSRLIPGGDPG